MQLLMTKAISTLGEESILFLISSDVCLIQETNQDFLQPTYVNKFHKKKVISVGCGKDFTVVSVEPNHNEYLDALIKKF